MSLRAAHVSAQGLSRLRTLARSVDADLRRVAACEAATAVLCSIQGDASSSAAVFSLRTFVATTTAIKTIEANICTCAATAKVFRPTAGIATLDFALRTRSSPTFRGCGPGHPGDGGESRSYQGRTYEPQRPAPREGAVGQPLGKLVERAVCGRLFSGTKKPWLPLCHRSALLSHSPKNENRLPVPQ